MTEKEFYSIREVADMLEIKPYILRYWEKEFAMLKPKRNRVGRRYYSRKDIDMIRSIKKILYEKGYTIALQMANYYIQKNNKDKALQLLTQLMGTYGDKVPPGMQEANWNQTRAFSFGMMAADSYSKKDYAKAIELYQKVTTFAPKSEEPWYFIGMAKWQSKDQKGAIEPFAKCFVIGGKQYSAKAKDYMEQLWKADHNNTLDGLDAVIAKAKSDLGIG